MLLKLDLGCGFTRREGYKRVDISAQYDPDYVADIRSLPFEQGSIKEIRASHVLEHIPQKDVFFTLRHWWMLLCDGGKLNIIVPDCGWAMREWAKGNIRDREVIDIVFGSDPNSTDFQEHKNMFWQTRVCRFLEVTGFVDIVLFSFILGELNVFCSKPIVGKNEGLQLED